MVCVFEYISVGSDGQRWVIERETRQVTNIGDAESCRSSAPWNAAGEIGRGRLPSSRFWRCVPRSPAAMTAVPGPRGSNDGLATPGSGPDSADRRGGLD